ncbi:MAG: transposase, partial [Chloroflexi bacterium]|nr:transposase [Chloroflexota bacterium]
MASRLYSTTRHLYRQVTRQLSSLQIATVGQPTAAALIALYVTGLILLDARQTQTRVARFLPGRCHDALNRLLRTMPLSTRALMALLIRWVQRCGSTGYLCLDDVVVEKAFAKRLPWAAWTYSFAKKRKVYGVHIVVLLWCSHDGHWRIPVAFRLWRPKRSCSRRAYRTKVQLAEVMLREVVAARLAFDYLV